MKILFPVDGTFRSLQTIQKVESIFDKKTVTADFIYILVPDYSQETEILVDRELADAFLEKARRTAQECGFQTTGEGHRIYDVSPAEGIKIYAQNNGIDMIVMGAHGYNGLEKLLKGSISESVMDEISLPVLIIQNDRSNGIRLSHVEKVKLHAQ